MKDLKEKIHKTEFHIRTINRMLKNKQYDFAKDTLIGIKEHAENNSWLSKRQVDTIHNIKRSIR